MYGSNTATGVSTTSVPTNMSTDSNKKSSEVAAVAAATMGAGGVTASGNNDINAKPSRAMLQGLQMARTQLLEPHLCVQDYTVEEPVGQMRTLSHQKQVWLIRLITHCDKVFQENSSSFIVRSYSGGGQFMGIHEGNNYIGVFVTGASPNIVHEWGLWKIDNPLVPIPLGGLVRVFNTDASKQEEIKVVVVVPRSLALKSGTDIIQSKL